MVLLGELRGRVRSELGDYMVLFYERLSCIFVWRLGKFFCFFFFFFLIYDIGTKVVVVKAHPYLYQFNQNLACQSSCPFD